MSRLDIANDVTVIQSIAPAAVTSDTDGSSADLANYNAAVVVIDVGTWTDGTHTFEVQESDDDSTWSAVADADLDGTEPVVDASGDSNAVHLIGYHGIARYLRVSVTTSGTTNGALYGASIVRGKARSRPV